MDFGGVLHKIVVGFEAVDDQKGVAEVAAQSLLVSVLVWLDVVLAKMNDEPHPSLEHGRAFVASLHCVHFMDLVQVNLVNADCIEVLIAFCARPAKVSEARRAIIVDKIGQNQRIHF